MDLYCRNDQQTLKLGTFPSVDAAQGYLNTTYLYPKKMDTEFGHIATWSCGAGAQLTCYLTPDEANKLEPLFRLTCFMEGGRIEIPGDLFNENIVDNRIEWARGQDGYQVIETFAGAIIINALASTIWVYTIASPRP